MKQIDERGNACPIPVVHTKKALESMDGETKLIVLVDNEPAVQNVTRFAEGKNCEVKSEKISDNEFKIEIMAENYTPADEEEEIVCAPSAKDDFIIAVSSNEMGQGEKALGQTLIKAFLFAVPIFPITETVSSITFTLDGMLTFFVFAITPTNNPSDFR